MRIRQSATEFAVLAKFLFRLLPRNLRPLGTAFRLKDVPEVFPEATMFAKVDQDADLSALVVTYELNSRQIARHARMIQHKCEAPAPLLKRRGGFSHSKDYRARTSWRRRLQS